MLNISEKWSYVLLNNTKSRAIISKGREYSQSHPVLCRSFCLPRQVLKVAIFPRVRVKLLRTQRFITAAPPLYSLIFVFFIFLSRWNSFWSIALSTNFSFFCILFMLHQFNAMEKLQIRQALTKFWTIDVRCHSYKGLLLGLLKCRNMNRI